MELTSAQRSHLRRLAHGLAPAVLVGRQGVTEAVLAEIDDALEARELIKVKLPGDRDERRAMADGIAARTDAAIAGLIGRMAILYRRNPDPDKRPVDLPD